MGSNSVTYHPTQVNTVTPNGLITLKYVVEVELYIGYSYSAAQKP